MKNAHYLKKHPFKTLIFHALRLKYRMLIKKLNTISKIKANDNSTLSEILNPLKRDLKIQYSLAWARVEPGEKTLRHKLQANEVYYILRGTGIMHINNEETRVTENDTVHIPPDAIQFIENRSKENLEFLCIVDPPWRPEIETILEPDQ
jgi:mannose-6-phosphate isomerase-like protein (cupin superfamily)